MISARVLVFRLKLGPLKGLLSFSSIDNSSNKMTMDYGFDG